MTRTAILGGGLSGRLTALQLAWAGFQTALFERGARSGSGSAGYIAAAMLAPAAEAVDAAPEVIALGRQSLPLWREWLARLPSPVFMQENGSLIVWHAQDKPLAAQFAQHLHRTAPDLPPEIWQAADISRNEPQLSGRFQTAFYLAGEGQLDNRQTLNALADALDEAGVDCRWQQEVSREDLLAEFDWVIDCRGSRAKEDWNRPSENKQNARSLLRGVRGEVARVYAPEVSLNRPVRLLHPRYPLYIAPKENHLFVIGATQIESESRAPVSVRSGLELLSALYAVHPAFGEAQLLETAADLRPTLQHHKPEIRYHTGKRLIEINGLFRHGFMIAPAVTAAAVRLFTALQNGGLPDCDTVSGLPFLRLDG
ncbi:MAG: FAD-dependent oxidoreductase [Neisseria sp.]|nr:FAD-dependent oxidoreductase [Neisseria sp.]